MKLLDRFAKLCVPTASRQLAYAIELHAEREMLACRIRMLGGTTNPSATIDQLRAEVELRMIGGVPKPGASEAQLREQIIVERYVQRRGNR